MPMDGLYPWLPNKLPDYDKYYVGDMSRVMSTNVPADLNNQGTDIQRCADKTCFACYPTKENFMGMNSLKDLKNE